MELQENEVIDLEQSFLTEESSIDHEQAHKDFVQIGKTCLYLVVLQLLGSMIMSALLINMIFRGGMNAQAVQVLSMVVGLIVTILTGLIVIRSGKKRLHISSTALKVKQPLSVKELLRYGCIGIGLSMCGSLLVLLINSILLQVGVQLGTPDLTIKNNVIYNFIFIINACIVAPIVEETLFRGIFTQALLRYDARFAVFASAMLFSMMHLNLVQGIPTFLLGLVLGYVFVKTKSVASCIILHLLNNLLAVVANFAQMSNELMVSVFGLIVLVIMIYGLISAFKHRKHFFVNLATNTKEHHLVRSFLHSWSIIVFIIICLFVTCSMYLIIL